MKIHYGFSELEYEGRQRRLNSTTLKDRKIIEDILEMYKIVQWKKGFNGLNQQV